MKKIHLAILGSTRGTNMLTINDAILAKRLNAKTELVISDKKNALILERAKQHNISAVYIDPANLSREAFDLKMMQKLQEFNIDLILLIGFMRILTGKFINTWKDKIINVHPSLLPAFAGGMDANVHRAVLSSGVKETGCTIHKVTEEVDCGPILLQKKCEVLDTDSVESLKARVQKLEGEALIEVINLFNSY